MRILEESLAQWPVNGHLTLPAWTRTVLGAVLADIGDRDGAEDCFELALPIWEKISCPWGTTETLCAYGLASLAWDKNRAGGILSESLAGRRCAGDLRGSAEAFEGFAELAEDRDVRAELLAEAQMPRGEIEAPVMPNRRPKVDEQIASCGRQSYARAGAVPARCNAAEGT